MREFAKVSPEFWIGSLNKKLKICTAETKVLAFYLLTCPSSTMLGIYYLPLLLAAHETGTPLEELISSIEALKRIDFCSYDETTEYVWIHDMAASQLGFLKKNDNRVKYVNSLFKKLPSMSFIDDFYKKYRDALHLFSESNPLTSPFEAIEKKKEKKTEMEKENPIISCERSNFSLQKKQNLANHNVSKQTTWEHNLSIINSVLEETYAS